LSEINTYILTGMASIDSSAPETTSSDNSPTLIRRTWKHQGPGSDCGSSGDSSDSLGSSSSGDKDARNKLRDNERYILYLTLSTYRPVWYIPDQGLDHTILNT